MIMLLMTEYNSRVVADFIETCVAILTSVLVKIKLVRNVWFHL